MKRLLHVVLFLAITSSVFSQRKTERFFMQIGGTLGADVMFSDGDIRKESFTTTNINYASVIFTSRLNFLQLSNNASISLGVQPTLSIGRAYNSVGGGGNLSFRLPGVIELNLGAAATGSTRKDVGFSIGGGVQYMKYPISANSVPVAPSKNSDYLGMYATWLEPVLVTGVKFFGKSYYCREVNLRFSYASKDEVNNATDLTQGEVINNFHSMGIMVSFLQYLNY